MFNVKSAAVVAGALALVGMTTAAKAQVLASADNGTTTIYTSGVDALYPLDGSETALTFRTTKANEVVQFSFAGARCGISQTAPQSNYVLNESLVEGYFYLDGALVSTATGNANVLCAYNVFPQAQYMMQLGAAQMQQRIVVPTAGTHTMGVLLQVLVTADGTNIYPEFGLSHSAVSK